MADQSEKRQQSRSWFPFLTNMYNPRTRLPLPRTTSSSSQPQPKTQSPPSDQSQLNNRSPRTPSLSPSPSKQKLKEPTPAPREPRRGWRSTPSSSPAESPSKRSPQLDQGKQKRKDGSSQPTRLSPSPSKSEQKPGEVPGEESPIKETIGPKYDQQQNIDRPTKEVNEVKPVVEKSGESRPLPFDPLIGVKPNLTAISQRDPIDNHEEKTRENHEKTSQSEENLTSATEISETQHEERYDPINDEITKNGLISLPAAGQVENHKEMINEDNPKETIKNDDPEETIKEDTPKETIKNGSPKETIKVENPKETIIEENPNEIRKNVDKTNQNESSEETIREMEIFNQETPHIEKPIIKGENDTPATKKDKGKLIQNPITNNHKHVDESSNENEEKSSIYGHNSNMRSENMGENYPRRKEKHVTSSSSTRPSFQKGIKEGISKLIQNINTGNSQNPGSDNGTFIITLAGENKGASMYIGHRNDHENNSFLGRGRKLNESNGESSNGILKNKGGEKENKNSEISSNVNSNVQSINNSVMDESSCNLRDPGVRFTLSNKAKTEKKMKKKDN